MTLNDGSAVDHYFSTNIPNGTTASNNFTFIPAVVSTTPEVPIKFSLFTTEVLKASKGTDGKMRIRGIASSTVKDYHGDTIQASAIEDMVQAASKNMTIFLNHSYEVPEDVAGSVEHASSLVRGADQAGNPNTDLILDIAVNESNPRAVQTWQALNSGTKLGLSIGANLPQGGYQLEKDGTYTINHIELMETSIVSLPANPRSWVEYAVKAIDPNKVFTRSTGCPDCGGGKDTAKNACANSYHTKTAEPTVAPTPEVDKLSAVGPTVVGEAGPEAVQVLESVVPDETKATVSINIDTQSHGSSSTGATAPSSQASPDAGAGTSALSEEGLDGEGALLGDTKTKEAIPDVVFTGILEQFQAVTAELSKTRENLGIEKAARLVAESERDAAKTQSETVLREVAALLTKLADTPLVRRTAVYEHQQNFKQKFGQWFDDDVLSIMEKASV